jgi:hypothetical protein
MKQTLVTAHTKPTHTVESVSVGVASPLRAVHCFANWWGGGGILGKLCSKPGKIIILKMSTLVKRP